MHGTKLWPVGQISSGSNGVRLYDTYEKAEVKLKKACNTSNLETSDEEDRRKSHNVRRKRDISQELEFLEIPDPSTRQQGSSKRAESPPYPHFEMAGTPQTLGAPFNQSQSPRTPSHPKSNQFSTCPSPLPTSSLYPPSFPSTSSYTQQHFGHLQHSSNHQDIFRGSDRILLKQIQMTLSDL